MLLTVTWADILLRLGFSALAGGLIGFNRGERVRAAGLRTTMLVSIAATIAMLQANLLLGTVGMPATSFVHIDVMRLPLGVLTGIGFIGAGAILRRGGLVVGVTTAAALWAATMIGFCFGGGQIGLGIVSTALVLGVLGPLQWFEERMRRIHSATLLLVTVGDAPSEAEIRRRLTGAGLRIARESVTFDESQSRHVRRYELRWRARASETAPPDWLAGLASSPGVARLDWTPGQID